MGRVERFESQPEIRRRVRDDKVDKCRLAEFQQKEKNDLEEKIKRLKLFLYRENCDNYPVLRASLLNLEYKLAFLKGGLNYVDV